MKRVTLREIENDIRHADCRHPVDFLEPACGADEGKHWTCGDLSRIFAWVADGSVEQRRLRAAAVLCCVRGGLIGRLDLDEFGAVAGVPAARIEELVADFRGAIGWQ